MHHACSSASHRQCLNLRRQLGAKQVQFGSGLFLEYEDLGGSSDDSFPVLLLLLLFLGGDQLARYNSRISPQWLSELRRLWPSVSLTSCVYARFLGKFQRYACKAKSAYSDFRQRTKV